ncbi:hypothetical protein ABT024_05055 [Streptomyces sp. NPDC002812]|uniref:hypothetical protein n=1 Tax=Streptomyces sp. NPDC002812 TaxID=3154434 RepID=UPI00332230F7
MNLHREIPLTDRWYLLAWTAGARFAVGAPVRCFVHGQDKVIGRIVSLAGLSIAVIRPPRRPQEAHRFWFRDFARFTCGGWRTGRTVPVSTGWIGQRKIGVSVTVASRTVYAARLRTRADYRREKGRR